MNIQKLAAPVAVLVTALAVIGAASGTAQATSVPQVNLGVLDISITGMHMAALRGKVTDPGAVGQYDIAAWGVLAFQVLERDATRSDAERVELRDLLLSAIDAGARAFALLTRMRDDLGEDANAAGGT